MTKIEKNLCEKMVNRALSILEEARSIDKANLANEELFDHLAQRRVDRMMGEVEGICTTLGELKYKSDNMNKLINYGR